MAPVLPIAAAASGMGVSLGVAAAVLSGSAADMRSSAGTGTAGAARGTGRARGADRGSRGVEAGTGVATGRPVNRSAAALAASRVMYWRVVTSPHSCRCRAKWGSQQALSISSERDAKCVSTLHTTIPSGDLLIYRKPI